MNDPKDIERIASALEKIAEEIEWLNDHGILVQVEPTSNEN